jgi:hypothetical protein
VLPFYEYIDPYTDEFQKQVAEAKSKYPAIAGIHEVEDDMYHKPDWAALGYGDFQKIVFHTDDPAHDYGMPDDKANMCGYVNAFLDLQQQLRLVVIVRKAVKDFEHRDLKYVMKVATLLHEVGHVHDIVNGINFDLKARSAQIIEAEVFANLFALERLAERQLVQSYKLLVEALRKASKDQDGYLGEVGRRVIQRLPEPKLIVWTDLLDSDLTPEDRRLLRGFSVGG